MAWLHDIAANAWSLLATGLLALAAVAGGRLIMRLLRLSLPDRTARLTWCLALGLAAGGPCIWCLAMLGILYRPLGALTTGMMAFWGAGDLAQEWFLWQDQRLRKRCLRSRVDPDASPQAAEPNSPAWPWLLVATPVVVATLLRAFCPTTDFSALATYLPIARGWVESHAVLASDGGAGLYAARLPCAIWAWALALDQGAAVLLTQALLATAVGGGILLLAQPVVAMSGAQTAVGLFLLTPAMLGSFIVPDPGCTWLLCWTCTRARWWAGPWRRVCPPSWSAMP